MTNPKPKRPPAFSQSWRPERKDKAHVYAVMTAFLERNPGIPYSRMLDMALARMFGDHDAKCRAMFDAEVIRFEPKWGDEPNGRSPRIDIPPDKFPGRRT
jgi:hypothetical protein